MRLHLVRLKASLPTPPTPLAEPVARPFQQDAQPTTGATRVSRAVKRRANRRALYERAAELHAQGYTVAATARLTGEGRSTLQDWFKQGQFPARATRVGALTPFVGFVLERMDSPEVTGQQIYDELVAQVYPRQRSNMYELLEWLRQGHLPPAAADHQRAAGETNLPPSKQFSAKRGAWWFIQMPEKLSRTAREGLGLLQALVEASGEVYRLIQEFAQLLRTQPTDAASQLTAWLDQALTSSVVELQRFANGIHKDAAAVLGTMTSPWSNGQVKGQVTRVKLLKRQMYGRAKFDLLRARILLA